MSDLLELAKRCEAAEGPSISLGRAITIAAGMSEVEVDRRIERGLWRNPTASLDAAVTLVPEGLAWTTGQNVHHWYWQTGVNRLNEDGAPESVSCSGPARTPALAICAAALRARAAA